ncbi:VOC family protein [Reichenbachiella ulvae]|uniref:VOC family protein n=1 Tax=Reichenbachiella ulvae TaxID=2980104 RepID=A0ABT3CT97_9BACT|nr:VOC family protein [Reichenbachiella ulvae]MCV9386849.1 VOC family protein [Reichenbachiella ulvae]
MSQLRPFHLAIPVKELEETRTFYNTTLNCSEGRSSDHWVDLDFYGHQLVLHISDQAQAENHNPVDGHAVPIPHFGVVLTMEDWKELADRLKKAAIEFIIEPYIRFEGEPGEQATMFFRDPSGNALEFKAFNNLDSLFAK